MTWNPDVKHPKSRNMLLLSLGLMVAGFAIALLGALADTLDIGTGQGFGYYQLIVVIAGIVTFLIGLVLELGQRTNARGDNDRFEPEP